MIMLNLKAHFILSKQAMDGKEAVDKVSAMLGEPNSPVEVSLPTTASKSMSPVAADYSASVDLAVKRQDVVGQNSAAPVPQISWPLKGAEMTQLRLDLDLIFMDVHMPVMDGIEATSIIKQKAPRVPVVMLTADITDEMRVSSMEAGAWKVLAKPVKQEQILKTLKNFLPKSGKVSARREEAQEHTDAPATAR